MLSFYIFKDFSKKVLQDLKKYVIILELQKQAAI